MAVASVSSSTQLSLRECLTSPLWDPNCIHTIGKKLLANNSVVVHELCDGPHFPPLSSSSCSKVKAYKNGEGGVMRFPTRPTKWCANRHGSMHGGLISALIDSLCAIHLYHSLNSRGGPYHFVTVHMNVTFLRPVPILESDAASSRLVTFSTELVRRGQRLVLFDCTVAEEDRILVRCQVTKLHTRGHSRVAATAKL